MVENQCETNCECVQQKEVQNIVMLQMNVLVIVKPTQIKSIVHAVNDDPFAGAKSLLEKSFFNALTEVHVEKLKKQIEREWGVRLTRQWI
jgi:hypothetical protein